MPLTPDHLAATAGVVLSLAASYTPGFSSWYDALTPTPKRLVMLAALAVAALGVLVYQCRGAAECYGANVETALSAFVLAAIANQAAAALTPLSPERRLVRQKAVEQHMTTAIPLKTDGPPA